MHSVVKARLKAEGLRLGGFKGGGGDVWLLRPRVSAAADTVSGADGWGWCAGRVIGFSGAPAGAGVFPLPLLRV